MPIGSSVEKAVGRLREAVRDGQAYEGLQTIKSLHRRLCSKGRNDQARELLSLSAVALWNATETAASLDLAKSLLQDCRNSGVKVDLVASQLEVLLATMAMTPPEADNAATASALQDETCSWAESAATWAWKAEPAADGSLSLLRLAGDVVLAARGPKFGARAYVLYARCNSVNSIHAALSHNLEAKGADWSMHTTRAALLLLAYAPAVGSANLDWPEQIAAATRIKTAGYLVSLCEQEQLQAPHFRGVPKDTMCLFNFCQFLLQVLLMEPTEKTSAQKLAAILRAHYMAALSRDPELVDLLDKALLAYLHIPLRENTGGMLGNLMAMMTS